MSIIDDINYFNDPRTQGPAPETITVYDPEVDGDTEIEIPSKWGVCPVCNGEGKHVNPSIDAGGLTAEDFHDDPDFAECYFGGMYDVTCNRCGGKRVVRVPDYEAMTDYDRKLLEEHDRAEAEFRAEMLAEIRMGC